MIAVVAAVVLIAGVIYFTSVDRTKPDAVATAFTKAYKAGNMSKASKYWLPADADTLLASTNDMLNNLRSNATEMFFARIPADPDFSPAVPSSEGVTTVESADKKFTLQMTKVGSDWYVSKTL